MAHVLIYGGCGLFQGGQFEWDSPSVGGTHKFMLFLAQEKEEPNQVGALKEVHRFGFRDVDLQEGRKIVVAVLNEPSMRAFQKHYEGAMTEGSSLVWYP